MIDLHVHTNNSDGELDIVAILKRAQALGLNYLSITDHDTIKAYKELADIDIKSYFTGQLIKGVELTFLYNDTIMEMLGYGVDIDVIDNFKYVKQVENTDIVNMHSERLEIIKRVCDDINIKYSENLKISEPNCHANDVLLDDIIKYAENKIILESMGIRDRTTFYRQHYCNRKSPFYVDTKKELPGIYDVSKVIRDAGGKCFIAHIFKYGIDNPKETLKQLIDMKVLDGVECYHKEHSLEQAKYLENICNKNNLLMSGGSDFHRDKDLMGHCNKYKDEIPQEIMKKFR